MGPTAALLCLAAVVLAAPARASEACNSLELTLSNGLVLPRVGLGTAGRMTAATVKVALAAGVRLFDTAQAYEWYDEKAVANALAASGLRRSEYVVVTKVHPRDHGFSRFSQKVLESAHLFGGYVDVVLQHYPRCWDGLCGPGWEKRVEGDFRDSWKALEEAYANGTAKAIGVSNFDVRDLESLLAGAVIVPHVHQGWMDPFHQDREMRQACADRGIAYMSYSTLGTQHRPAWSNRAAGPNPVLNSPVISAAAGAFGPAAAALSWALQRGAVVMPRSFSPAHVRSNADLFAEGALRLCLAEDALAAIDALDGTLESRFEARPAVVQATFSTDVSAALFWVDATAEILVAALRPGEDVGMQTSQGHTFVARVADGNALQTFVVTARPGAAQAFHVEFQPEL